MKKKLLLQDIVDYIAQHEGLNPEDADAFVRSFFDIVEQGLQEDKIVKIKGLGTFKLVAVSERESVNINTGERFQIEGHSKISFTPDNSMKELINRPFAHFEPVELSEDTDTEEFNEVDKEVLQEFEDSGEDADDEDDNSTDSDADNDESDADENAADETADDQEEEETEANDTDTSDEGNAVTIELDLTPASTKPISEPVQTPSEENRSDESAEEKNASENPQQTEEETKPEEDKPTEGISLIAKSDDTPQPTIIAPPDLAETDNKRETAKIRIDSNDDENDTDENGKVETPSAVNGQESNDSSDNNEEEIVVTPPRPITSEYQSPHTSNTMGYAYVEVPSRRKVNWWKRSVLVFLFILALILSYFAGYYRLLCPCTLLNLGCDETPVSQTASHVSTQNKQAAEPQVNDSTENSDQTSNNLQPEAKEEGEAEGNLSEKAEKKADLQKKEEQRKAEVKATATEAKQPAEQKVSKPSKAQKQDKQSQEAKRPRTHIVKSGDTLYRIARTYYGSEDAIHKIIKYNHLKDADHIQLGMELKLP